MAWSGEMEKLIRIEEPQRAQGAVGGKALWALGFRPFYLCAGIFSGFRLT